MAGIVNHTNLLARARAFLGQGLTGQTDFKDADFLRCLEEQTLPVFSIYVPWKEDVTIDVRRDQIDPSRPQIFALRSLQPIISVDHVREATDAFGAFPYSPLFNGDTLDRQLIADRRSMTEIALTVEFRPPNVVEVFPKGLCYVYLTCKCNLVHPAHLRTVPMGAYEDLKELFLCDLAADVLSVRQYFTSIQTVFGELNLNLERLQKQVDKRDELITKLTNKKGKTGTERRIWIM
jgi:hypothetical protein